MRFKKAFRRTVIYQLLAIVPRIIGLSLLVGALWFGAVEPLLDAGYTVSEFADLNVNYSDAIGLLSIPIIVGGLLSSYIITKSGKQIIMFYLFTNSKTEDDSREQERLEKKKKRDKGEGTGHFS